MQAPGEFVPGLARDATGSSRGESLPPPFWGSAPEAHQPLAENPTPSGEDYLSRRIRLWRRIPAPSYDGVALSVLGMSNILVTGATGQIGSSLCRRLVEEGHNVTAFILPKTWHPFLDGLKLNIVYGNICNYEDVIKAMRGQDFVYQVAGIVSYSRLDHAKMYAVHCDGVRNVLTAAKECGVKKVVVTASTAGIGIPENKNQPLAENAPFDFKKYQRVMYMYSKHLKIKLCQEFAQKGLNVSIVSPTTVYGQGDMEMHVGKMVKKIKNGQLRSAPPGGNAVVSVDDVVDAHLLVMERGTSGANYIFADECLTYFDMYNRIAKLLGAPPIRRITPAWTLPFAKLFLSVKEHILTWFGKKPSRSPHALNFSFKCRYFDSSKARRELGWQSKVSFAEAMRKAIQFYTERGLI